MGHHVVAAILHAAGHSNFANEPPFLRAMKQLHASGGHIAHVRFMAEAAVIASFSTGRTGRPKAFKVMSLLTFVSNASQKFLDICKQDALAMLVLPLLSFKHSFCCVDTSSVGP